MLLIFQEVEKERRATVRRSASLYSFNGDSFVEYLHGASPIEEVEGEQRYTVPQPIPKPKKKKIPFQIVEPVLGDSPTIGLRVHYICYKTVSSSAFEGFIIFCIMFNTMLMAIEHYEQSESLSFVLDIFNYVSILCKPLKVFYARYRIMIQVTFKCETEKLFCCLYTIYIALR